MIPKGCRSSFILVLLQRLSSTKSTEKRNKNATPKTIPVDPEYGRTSQRFDINNEFFNRGPAPRQSPRAAQVSFRTCYSV